jgi:molecular chaperone IbpA
MASGYPIPNPHDKDQWGIRDPWPKERPKTTPASTVITLPALFSDQFFIGFNDQVERWSQWATINRKPTSFPPYNLIRVDEDNYTVELAVAGYTREDIEITVEKDMLTVKSITEAEKTKDKVIHQGIAERSWSQQFVLGEFMEVKSADLKDGLLTIKVKRELPEELKPKVIKIK